MEPLFHQQETACGRSRGRKEAPRVAKTRLICMNMPLCRQGSCRRDTIRINAAKRSSFPVVAARSRKMVTDSHSPSARSTWWP